MNLEKVPVNNSAKVPVNILKLPVNFWKKFCPRTQKSAREPKKNGREPQKCPWTFSEKNARARKFLHFRYFWGKSAREPRKVPVNILNFFAREPRKVPVKKSQKVPVNAKLCPWIFLKKCPWTQNCAREHLRKNEVHGHFWCSRGKKKKHWCIVLAPPPADL